MIAFYKFLIYSQIHSLLLFFCDLYNRYRLPYSLAPKYVCPKETLVRHWRQEQGRNRGILTSLFVSFDVSVSSCVSSMVRALTGRPWLLGCDNSFSIIFSIPTGGRGLLLLLTHGLGYSTWLLKPSVIMQSVTSKFSPCHNASILKTQFSYFIFPQGLLQYDVYNIQFFFSEKV